uniref:Retrotransposon gag domain-containing protein n=1 Tax=Nothobranchius furzeri TaxID=105023 RepID=A0A8C6PFS7_NOTFU
MREYFALNHSSQNIGYSSASQRKSGDINRSLTKEHFVLLFFKYFYECSNSITNNKFCQDSGISRLTFGPQLPTCPSWGAPSVLLAGIPSTSQPSKAIYGRRRDRLLISVIVSSSQRYDQRNNKTVKRLTLFVSFIQSDQPDRMTEIRVDSTEIDRLRHENVQLRSMVDQLNTKVNSLSDHTLRLSTALTALQQQANDQQQQIAALQQPTRSAPREEPHFSLPERWNGETGSPDGLLATLDMQFECQPGRYPSARSRVAHLTSLLSGRAAEWAAALYNSKSPACNDYAAFVSALRKTFVPPSSEVGAETRLLKLRQRERSVCAYASEFRTISAKLQWNDSALRAAFLEGLAPYIRDELAGRELPQTLDEVVDLALRIDQRVLVRPKLSTR